MGVRVQPTVMVGKSSGDTGANYLGISPNYRKLNIWKILRNIQKNFEMLTVTFRFISLIVGVA